MKKTILFVSLFLTLLTACQPEDCYLFTIQYQYYSQTTGAALPTTTVQDMRCGISNAEALQIRSYLQQTIQVVTINGQRYNVQATVTINRK